MFAKERQARNRNLAVAEFFHFRDLNDILESGILEKQFERWILKMPASIAWNNNIFYFMPDLQERFKQHVILMIMGDQHIIDLLRQVGIGIARDVTFVGIAELRIKQHRNAVGFNENASVAEIPPAHSRAGIGHIGRWRFGSQEGLEEAVLRISRLHYFFDYRPGLRFSFETE